ELTGARGSYRADAFVLATGDWVGGGMRGLREPVLGLDVSGSIQLQKIPLPENGHPYALSGVRVDSRLRAMRHGERVENLRIAGALLAGYDYCTEKSGWGVAIASGYLAGGME
ncbi:MAG: anaerobic glycerol-3-phosphate dehydrogenase subunit B, partial [Euryarchaeota archaeon]|nr:anaerobic glycerol-3-phosphate dehydrogenase subunit B [Euryarchaeota archaeon]